MSNNCLILGSGRSGSSLVAGLFRNTGHYLGADLREATTSNPRGYFEDHEIIDINERLLDQVVWAPPGLSQVKSGLTPNVARLVPVYGSRTTVGQHLLAVPAGLGKGMAVDETLAARMVAQTRNTPFAFKDPRFSFTLPAWRPYLPADTVFVCVFRHPVATVASMVKDTRDREYLYNLRLSERRAYKAWHAAYSNLLRQSDAGGNWLFVEYEDVLSGRAVDAIESLVGTELDRSVIAPELRHARNEGSAPRHAMDLLWSLRRRASLTQGMYSAAQYTA